MKDINNDVYNDSETVEIIAQTFVNTDTLTPSTVYFRCFLSLLNVI
jgi:hypothetical protein